VQLAREWQGGNKSLLLAHQKLTKLGFTYYNGKAAVIESSEKVLIA
jgi:hypothetical protein